MPSTPRNANDRDLEEGLPASLPASSSETSGLILPSTAEQHTGIGMSTEDDSGQEPPSSVLAETQIETIDDEDPPAPFDPSEFEEDEDDMTNKIETVDDDAAPAPFDPSAFEVDDEDMTNNNMETVDDDAAPAPFDPSAFEVNDEDKTNNVKTVDDESPPAPFGPSEFEVDEGVREGGNNSVQIPSEIDPIPIPQREDIEEGRDQSLTRLVCSSRAGMLLANINDSRHLYSGESPTNPVERNAHSLGVDARTVDVVSLRTYALPGTSADVLLRTDAPTSRYAVRDDAMSAADDSLGTDDSTFRPALERDSIFRVPVAWPVPLADEGEVVIATPTPPWWKQRRIQLLLIILAALSIALGVTLSRSPSNDFSALSLSITPSSSITPSASPSFSTFPSASPTEVCFWIEISIMHDAYPEQTSWELSREVNNTWNLYKEGDNIGAVGLPTSQGTFIPIRFFESLCLQGGKYKFEIIDTGLDGICCRNGGWGYYNVTASNGGVIAEGGKFGGSESATFTIPFVTTPSSMPSISRSPSSSSPPSISLTTQPSMTPSISLYPSMSPSSSSVPSSSSAPTETCYWIDITIVYDLYPEEIWLELWKSVDVGQDYEVTRSQKEVGPVNYELVKLHEASLGDTLYSESICLQEGEYIFTIFDIAWGNGICCQYGLGNYNVTTSNGVLIAEGGMFFFAESTTFTIPFITAPSSMPSFRRSPASSSSSSTIPSFSPAPSSLSFASTIPTSTVTSSACTWIELSVIYNQYSFNLWAVVELYRRGVGGGDYYRVYFHEASFGDISHDKPLCLQEGDYLFIFVDSYGGKGCTFCEGQYNISKLDGELLSENSGGLGRTTKSRFLIPFVDPCTICPNGTTADEVFVPHPEVGNIYACQQIINNGMAWEAGSDTCETNIKSWKQICCPTTIPPSFATSPTTQSPTVQPDCNLLDVKVTLDQHPSDIRWEIVGSRQGFNTIVAVSPPYDASMAYSTDTQSFCLVDGTYQFSIYDDYGDGS